MYPKFASPKTLTKTEQRRLLRAVRAHGSPRDRALLSLALSTGLRLRELAGLNVGDVRVGKAGTAWKIVLDPELTKGKRGGVAYVSSRVRQEMRSFLAWKRRAREPLDPRSSLFLSRQGRRISLRRIQFVFREWQAAAGFETLYPFHALRHSDERVPGHEGSLPHPAFRSAFEPAHDHHLHASQRRGALRGAPRDQDLIGPDSPFRFQLSGMNGESETASRLGCFDRCCCA